MKQKLLKSCRILLLALSLSFFTTSFSQAAEETEEVKEWEDYSGWNTDFYTAGAVEGQTTVLNGTIRAKFWTDQEEGRRYGGKEFSKFKGASSNDKDLVRRFTLDTGNGLLTAGAGRYLAEDFQNAGLSHITDFPLDISYSKGSTINYGMGEKDYNYIYSGALQQNGGACFSPIANSSTMYAIHHTWDVMMKSSEIDECLDGPRIEYSVKLNGMKLAANNYATVLANYYVRNKINIDHCPDAWQYKVLPKDNVKVFPEKYEDLVYLEKEDLLMLCPWLEMYEWENGKVKDWIGTREERDAVFAQYQNSSLTKADYVNGLWKSLTGTEHKFLERDIFSRYPSASRLTSPSYNEAVSGELTDLLATTVLPSSAGLHAEKEEYYYSTATTDKKKYFSYTEARIDEAETMTSTWQVSNDAKTWQTVATNVRGTRKVSYSRMSNTLRIGSGYATENNPVIEVNIADVLPPDTRTIYVRRVSTCGDTFWSGTVTSPALRIRPTLTLDSLEVKANKAVVEGDYLDPKDITVIAHYNTSDTVLSGDGDYIEYPGTTSLRATKVGTNYGYFVYTDPNLGDVIRGYFPFQGVEKSPVSITAEYVGPDIVEKRPYSLNDVRVNVTFNNGTVDTFTADSSNVGVYKTKSFGKGDLDGNGILNNADVTVLESIVKGSTATSAQKTQADFNKDGKINTDDVTALKAIMDRTVSQVGTNTFYAAFARLKMSDGSPIYARFTVKGVKKSPYALSVTTMPEKTSYIEGEDFEEKGLILKVLYDNGEYTYLSYADDNAYYPEVEFGDEDHSIYDMPADIRVMPVYYTENGVTIDAEIPINISLTTLTSIKVTRPPDTVIYYSGETFKTTGMDVTAYFDEGIPNHDPEELLLTSSEYILTSYRKLPDGGMSVVFLLDDPTSMPDATGDYLLVEKKDLEDGQDLEDQTHATFRLKNGKSFEGTVCGNHLVKISYTNRGTTKHTYQPIYVYGKRPTALTIVSLPYVTEYIAGQNFLTDGLILRVAYSDGSSAYLYAKNENRNGYEILDSQNLTSDRGFVIAQYTENAVTLQIEIPITVIDPSIDGITASYLGPAVYVGNQFNPKDVQIVVSYTNGSVASFRANETNSDGTKKVKIVLPKEDGTIDQGAAEHLTVGEAGMNQFAACYAGFTDIFEVNGIDNPDQIDFSGSIAKTKRMYDTWTENFSATKIRSVADYINGRVELTDRQSVDEYHVVVRQNTTDTRTSLSYEEGTGQGINLDTSDTVSPLLSFLRQGTWRQPETVISVSYKGRTHGYLYPETTNEKFTQKYDTDTTYIDSHNQTYDTPKNTLQGYLEEGWSDWTSNGDTVGTVQAERIAYDYTGNNGDAAPKLMELDRLKIKLDNVPEGSAPQLNVSVIDVNGQETSYPNISENDTIINPSMIKIDLGGTVQVVDNYGQTVSKPFGEVYKVYYRTGTDDAEKWKTGGEWSGYNGVRMQCLEIRLMLQETDFNTGSTLSAPVINRQPQDTTVLIGGNATFSVLAVGNNLFYQWYVNGSPIAGANSAVYTTPEQTLDNNGDVYYCQIIAENGLGTATKSDSATLTVRDSIPVLTQDLPEKITGKVGNTVDLMVQAYSLNPDGLTYEWQITQNGTYVPLAGGDGNTISVALTADMHGEYIRCRVINDQGVANSNPCLISCIEAPIVTIKSSAASEYITSAKVDPVTFTASVESDATGKLEYKWEIDGVPEENTVGNTISWIPSELGTHTITCSVTDRYGNVGTSTLKVYVGEEPEVALRGRQITEEDQSTTMIIIADVASYNSENLTYAWSFDGASIVGNTNVTESADHKTLTIRNIVAGGHSVGLVVKDGFGEASVLEGFFIYPPEPPEPPVPDPLPDVEYAVSLYGIEHDTYKDENGNIGTAGLTFGPATGKSYRDAIKAHTPTGNTTSGNAHRCIHNDNWSTIASWSQKDPYVYEQCIDGGGSGESCTQQVPIALNEKIKETSYKDMLGDGTGMLYYSINQDYRKWNRRHSTYFDTSSQDYKYGTNKGGWPDSAVRNTLNGTVTDNMLNITNKGNGFAEAKLDESSALISCFPAVLREAIVPKAVKSDIVYNDVTGNNVVTYDKLWLLSSVEAYVDSGSDNGFIRPNEGTPYERITKLGITTSNYPQNTGYNELGHTEERWLRSVDRSMSSSTYGVNYDGNGWFSISTDAGLGLAPGFCLK